MFFSIASVVDFHLVITSVDFLVVLIALVDRKLHHLNETDFFVKNNNLCLFILVVAKVIKKVAMEIITENHIRK
jgi:hypothetical protein